VRVDQADGADQPTRSADTPVTRGAREVPHAPSTREAGVEPTGASVRVSRALGYQAGVEAVNRRYAIDRGYERIREIEEKTVTPAMRRIEAEDPERQLSGLENRLKGKDRLTEKINEAVDERGRTVHEALGMVKDAIRYTFCYPDDRYTEGVYADCQRLDQWGLERMDRINSWSAEEYKGINSRWRVPGSGQMFEVQFHTPASLDAKEETHWAYERLRTLPEDDAEVAELHAYQRQRTSKVAIPPGAADVLDYKYR
jgi:hypothetical protein